MESLEKIISSIKSEAEVQRQWLYKNFKLAEEGKFIAVAMDNEYFKLFPGPEFSSDIYRGQTSFYDLCTPSIYRDTNYIDRFIALMRFNEFKYLLYKHPALIDIKKLSIDNKQLKLDYEGMAQHYGLMTELLDFTSDIDIALFFATNDYIAEKKLFKPVLDKNRIGVIYKFNYALDFAENYVNPNYEVIGMQPLPRPGAQNAYSYRLKKDKNLNTQKNISYIKFKHSPDISAYYSEKYLKGENLFPKDGFDNKLELLKKSNAFSKKAFDIVYEKNHALSYNKTMKKLNKLGYSIFDDYLYDFSCEELNELATNWNEEKDKFLSKIGIRLAYYV